MILDACCGSKMFYFDKSNPDVIFGDIRKERHVLCDGRKLEINPDIRFDFRNMPFKSESFTHVVFDPPHLNKIGDNAWMKLKYGKLTENWEDDISKGFSECFRVLKSGGTLIFKWNETQIPVSKIIGLSKNKALLGHKRAGKTAESHFIIFIK